MYTQKEVFDLLSGLAEIMRVTDKERQKRIESLKHFYSSGYNVAIARDKELWDHITNITR